VVDRITSPIPFETERKKNQDDSRRIDTGAENCPALQVLSRQARARLPKKETRGQCRAFQNRLNRP